MTNRQRTKVRFVKCPKCAEILPEPEDYPLYTCGGCGTILQAKYYRGDDRATDVGHAPDGGESGGLSQSSSSVGEQSTNQNGLNNQNAVENGKSEQIEYPNSSHHTSVSEESTFPDGQGNGVMGNTTNQFDWREQVVNQNQEDFGTENSVSGVSFTEPATVLENKGSDEFTTEIIEAEDINRRDEHGNDTIENPNQPQIGDPNYARDTLEVQESQVLENEEQPKVTPDHAITGDIVLQLPAVNRAIENEDSQHGLSSDTAFDNENQVREVSSTGEESVLNESLAVKDKELYLSASENGMVHDGSDLNMLKDTRNEYPESKHSNETTSAVVIHSHDIMPQAITSLTVEDKNSKDQNDFVECTWERLESINLSQAPLPTNVTLSGNVDLTSEIEPSSRGCRSDVASVPSSATDQTSNGAIGSSNISKEPQCESNLAEKLTETSEQQIENFDKSDVYGPEQLRVTDSPDLLEPVNKHGEVGGSVKVVPRSLTKGSLAYDGSVSSFDGNDDQVLEQHDGDILEETLPGNGAVAGYVGAEDSLEWSNVPSRRAYSNSRTQNSAKHSSQELLDEKVKNGKEILGRNRVRPNRDRIPPRGPFHRNSEVPHEADSSSSYIHDELPSHHMLHHPYRFEDLGPWVRKMYTQKVNMDRRRFPEAAWRESEFLPIYHNYESSGEFYHRSEPYGYTERRRRAESWSQSSNLQPMPYSGEIFNGRYHIRDSYMHRHPDEIRWSAQLPSRARAFCCHQGLCATPSREISWDQYDPYPTSSQQFMDSESYPWAHDTMSLSDDQRHRDQVMRRLYLKEKQQSVKRYVRPMAGGAPFVICYFCFKVLQLPEDFLLSRRVTNRLRCGDCSSILEFSLENGSASLAPCVRNASPTAKATSDRNIDSASMAHANHSRQSSLLTGEAQAQFEDGTELLSHNSLGPSNAEKRKLESRNSRNKERMEGSHYEEGSSVQARHVKVTWQLPARSKSPLHRLMGYPSPHDLLNEHEIEEVE